MIRLLRLFRGWWDSRAAKGATGRRFALPRGTVVPLARAAVALAAVARCAGRRRGAADRRPRARPPLDAHGRASALRAPAAPGLAAGFDWLRRSEGSTPAFAWTGPSLASNGFDSLWSPPAPPVPRWKCRRRPVTFVGLGAERDSFPLVLCDDGGPRSARSAVDCRPRDGRAAPGWPPARSEPDPTLAEQGEWTRGVRIIHPRLLWAMQRLADAFPWRTIYVYSGYRPTLDAKPGSHASRHCSGRALDVGVLGVANEQLFGGLSQAPRRGLRLVPNSKFIHVDVRGPATGHPFWITSPGPVSRRSTSTRGPA